MFTQCSSGVYHVKLTESLEAKRLSKSELTDDILPKKRVHYDFSAQELQRYANSISKSKTVNKTPRRVPTAVKTIKTSNNKTDVFRYPRVAAHSPAIGAAPTRKVSSQKQRPNKKGKK